MLIFSPYVAFCFILPAHTLGAIPPMNPRRRINCHRKTEEAELKRSAMRWRVVWPPQLVESRVWVLMRPTVRLLVMLLARGRGECKAEKGTEGRAAESVGACFGVCGLYM